MQMKISFPGLIFAQYKSINIVKYYYYIALAVSFLFSNILPHRVTYLETSIFQKNTPKLDVIFTLNSLGVFALSSDKIYF